MSAPSPESPSPDKLPETLAAPPRFSTGARVALGLVIGLLFLVLLVTMGIFFARPWYEGTLEAVRAIEAAEGSEVERLFKEARTARAALSGLPEEGTITAPRLEAFLGLRRTLVAELQQWKSKPDVRRIAADKVEDPSYEEVAQFLYAWGRYKERFAGLLVEQALSPEEARIIAAKVFARWYTQNLPETERHGYAAPEALATLEVQLTSEEATIISRYRGALLETAYALLDFLVFEDNPLRFREAATWFDQEPSELLPIDNTIREELGSEVLALYDKAAGPREESRLFRLSDKNVVDELELMMDPTLEPLPVIPEEPGEITQERLTTYLALRQLVLDRLAEAPDVWQPIARKGSNASQAEVEAFKIFWAETKLELAGGLTKWDEDLHPERGPMLINEVRILTHKVYVTWYPEHVEELGGVPWAAPAPLEAYQPLRLTAAEEGQIAALGEEIAAVADPRVDFLMFSTNPAALDAFRSVANQ